MMTGAVCGDIVVAVGGDVGAGGDITGVWLWLVVAVPCVVVGTVGGVVCGIGVAIIDNGVVMVGDGGAGGGVVVGCVGGVLTMVLM